MVVAYWKMFVSLEMELMVLFDNLTVVEVDKFGYNCNLGKKYLLLICYYLLDVLINFFLLQFFS